MFVVNFGHWTGVGDDTETAVYNELVLLSNGVYGDNLVFRTDSESDAEACRTEAIRTIESHYGYDRAVTDGVSLDEITADD